MNCLHTRQSLSLLNLHQSGGQHYENCDSMSGNHCIFSDKTGNNPFPQLLLSYEAVGAHFLMLASGEPH